MPQRAQLAAAGIAAWLTERVLRPSTPAAAPAPAPGNVEIAYIGPLPRFIGCGLGAALLAATVERAWAMGVGRVWVHTCSLDHPSALPAYQARGSRVFDVVHTEEDLVGIGLAPPLQPADVEAEAVAQLDLDP